tara:strand:- start:276 stop:1052 length:777 start_codon:yes stop_codon:yes gene_type:complete
MGYKDKQVKEMNEALLEIESRFKSLLRGYLSYEFKNKTAKEYATHGLNRRLETMLQCIKNVFEHCPPDGTNIPSKNELNNATIAIQAFIANTAGALDNVAWVIAKENDVRDKEGLALDKSKISLFASKEIKQSCSIKFQKELQKYGNWNKNLKDYRDTLMHRIPLYIPGYGVDPKNIDKYNEIEHRAQIALYKDCDLDEYKRLMLEQDQYKYFSPIMLHSWNETEKKIWFLPQLIADFRTVLELAEKLLVELKSNNGS